MPMVLHQSKIVIEPVTTYSIVTSLSAFGSITKQNSPTFLGFYRLTLGIRAGL